MKSLLLGALLLGASSFHPASAQSAPDADAQKTWKEVRDLTRQLDADITACTLAPVHDDALNLRDAVRDLRDASAALDAHARVNLDALIRRSDALVDDLHESADHNDGRTASAQLRGYHLLLDRIALAFPTHTLAPIGPITVTKPVKDPVCRMTVDPATALAKVPHAGQMYYFCSKDDAHTFAKSPASYAKLWDDLAWGQPKHYAITLQARNLSAANAMPQANARTRLAFGVREAGKTALVSRFQPVHERLVHLIMVKDDLSWFAHEHPQPGADGRLYLDWTFPSAGSYWLYADLTPRDGSNQMLKTQVNIGGVQAAATAPLVADTSLVKTLGDVRVSLKVSPRLKANQSALLTYTLTRGGQPVRDLEPYLGAMGHLMAISQNGHDAVHTHAVGPGLDPLSGLDVTPALATSSGPNVSFKLDLPTGGIYRVWAQFQRGGQVITVPFTFNVADATPKAKTVAAMPRTQATPKIPTNARRITLALPDGYRSGAATLKAGQPVALTFFLASDAGCGNEISVPAANWRRRLKVGEKATLVYTPTKSGPLAFRCSMNHFKGTLLVK